MKLLGFISFDFYIFETKRFPIVKRDVFQGIADPTRRSILAMLSRSPKTVNEVAADFEMSRTAVSKHITMLKECGLVYMTKKGREHHLHAQLDQLDEVAIWINQYRLFWNDSLSKLETLLKNENTQKTK